MDELKKIATTLKIANPYWEYRIDKYSLNSGSSAEYHYVHSAGSVIIIPVFEDGQFLMVKQFRYLNQKDSIEFPGGGVKRAKSHLESAMAELEEETGFIASKFSEIGEFNPCNGITNEICKVYKAVGLKKTEQKLDKAEQIFTVKIPHEKIEKLMQTNSIWDGMTIVAWNMYKNSSKIK